MSRIILHTLQHHVCNSMGRATAKNIPVRIPNVSAYSKFLLCCLGTIRCPAEGFAIFTLCTCSSWAHRGCCDCSSKLLGISSEVSKHISLLLFRSPRGDCAHPWTLTLCTWHLWFGLAPMKLIWAAWKGGGSLFLSCTRETAAAFSPWQKKLSQDRGRPVLLPPNFSPPKSFNLSRLPLCKPPAHVCWWT